MKVLVTGSEGYIGTVLAEILGDAGHAVVGLDTGFYRDGWLYDGVRGAPETIVADIRDVTADQLRGYDAIVHMAELSNDPLGELQPDITYAINHRGSVHLATMAREAGVERFVYTSSCSVYGVAGDDVVDEMSPVSPQTAYADCKRLVERDVSALATESFSPVFLRNATVYGASPRMRFDIVVNNLSGLAWTTREVRMQSDGTPWRPLVHLRDVGAAIQGVLEAPREVIHGEIFNVGSTDGNYRVREVAEIVASVIPGCSLSFGEPGADNRSYRVSFEKIRAAIPGFTCAWDVEKGVHELHDVFSSIAMDADVFESRHYTRLKQIRHLIESGQVDEGFHWGTGAPRR